MGYLKITDLSGKPTYGGGKFHAGVPYVWTSKWGSKKSNQRLPNRRVGWATRYDAKNTNRRRNKR